jgi:membrane protease YdiL (CAAX protease family)
VFWASGFVYLLFPGHNLLPGVLYRLVACVVTAAGFLFLLRVADYNSAPWPRALSLPLDGIASRQFVAGVAVGALLIGADVAIIQSLGVLRFDVQFTAAMLLRAALGSLLLLFGALLEELTFRGYPFEKLTESCGMFWAIVLLSGLFGALHLGNPDSGGFLSWGFFNTLAFGLLFALARIRSGSLWLSFGLHFSWNLFQGVAFGLPVSGLREFGSLVVATADGPLWLTGGAYGPEASAICSLVLIIGVPAVWVLTTDPKYHHPPAASSGI